MRTSKNTGIEPFEIIVAIRGNPGNQLFSLPHHFFKFINS